MNRNPLRALQNENIRLKEDIQSLRDEVRTLRDFVESLTELAEAASHIGPESDIMPILDKILLNTLSILGSADGSILLKDFETGELVFVLVHGRAGKDLQGYRIPGGTGIAGWVMEHEKADIVNQVNTDVRFSPLVDEIFTFRTESMIAAPLLGHRRALGVVEVINKRSGKPFDERDKHLITLICRFAGEILAQIDETFMAEEAANAV